MAGVKCAVCNKGIADEDVFRHQGKTYCPKCLLKYIKNEYEIGKFSHEKEKAKSKAVLEHEVSKHSSEGRKAHIYTDY
jgi:uncharacterized Zn finger protein (UPF0148 family)